MADTCFLVVSETAIWAFYSDTHTETQLSGHGLCPQSHTISGRRGGWHLALGLDLRPGLDCLGGKAEGHSDLLRGLIKQRARAQDS